jgi:DNA-binding NarL/FixJ family response regulator
MIKVAIADDHKMFCEGISTILSQNEDIHTYTCVEDGSVLLNFLKDNEVDVVLLDLNMLEIGGVEASKIILKKYPKVKIIIVSMYKKPMIIKNLLEMGVHGYVLKDSGGAVLAEAIRKVYQGEKYFDEEVKNTLMNQFTSQESIGQLQLTPREIEILRLICKSLTSKEIADQLCISANTVETHRKNIMAKTGAVNSVALVRFAFENQLV